MKNKEYSLKDFGMFEELMSSRTGSGKIVDFWLSKILINKIKETYGDAENIIPKIIKEVKEIMRDMDNQKTLMEGFFIKKEIPLFKSNLNIVVFMETESLREKLTPKDVYIFSETEIN